MRDEPPVADMTAPSREVRFDVKAAQHLALTARVSPQGIHPIVQRSHDERRVAQKVPPPALHGREVILERPGPPLADDQVHQRHPREPFVFLDLRGGVAEKINLDAPPVLESRLVRYEMREEVLIVLPVARHALVRRSKCSAVLGRHNWVHGSCNPRRCR